MIVGIHGKKNAGKDTFAGFLKKHRHDLHLTALADHVKRICSVAFHVPINHFYDYGLKEVELREWGLSPRQMMTRMSDAVKDEFGEDFFVRVLKNHIASLAAGIPVVVTDVRYEYEVAFIRSMGGKIVHVLRPVADVPPDHSSEYRLEINPADYLIENFYTLDDLEQDAISLLSVLH